MTLAQAFLDEALESLAGSKMRSDLTAAGDRGQTGIRADRPAERWLIGEWA